MTYLCEMALIKFGAVVTDARGKLGGHVFTKTRNGNTLRTKVTPANPRTTDQQLVRSRLGALSSGWSQLTEAQRLSWQNAVAAWQSTNIFGDIVNPSGKNLYVKLNINLVNVGEPQIQVAPLPAEMPVLDVTVSNTSATGPEIDVTGGGIDFIGVLRATSPQNQGLFNPSGRFRQISNQIDTNSAATAIFGAYDAKFGTIAVGRKVFLEVVPIHLATGTPGVPVIVSFIAT